jgi:hypothetical protein
LHTIHEVALRRLNCGVQRTREALLAISALDQEPSFPNAQEIFAVPQYGFTRTRLIDHLVGKREQVGRDSDALRLCCLEIDDELELVDLLHGQVGRLGSIDYLGGI